jgi:hypothetical protein
MHPSICFSPLLTCMYRRASNKVLCRHSNSYSLLLLKFLTVLKIFGIYEDAQLTRGTFWDSMSRELGKKGQEYKNRCVVRSVCGPNISLSECIGARCARSLLEQRDAFLFRLCSRHMKDSSVPGVFQICPPMMQSRYVFQFRPRRATFFTAFLDSIASFVSWE